MGIALVGNGAFHHADLPEHALSGVVSRNESVWNAVFCEETGGALDGPVRRNTLMRQEKHPED